MVLKKRRNLVESLMFYDLLRGTSRLTGPYPVSGPGHRKTKESDRIHNPRTSTEVILI